MEGPPDASPPPPRTIYLDNAATSFPKPPAVVEAVTRFLAEQGGNPGRGHHAKAVASEEILLSARRAVARLLGAPDPSRVIFTGNATEAINAALKGWLRTGDHVVASDLEHNATLRPLHRLKGSRGIEVTIVASDAEGRIDPAAFRAAITPRTRLFCCVGASNVLGVLLPIREIGAIGREHGIPLLVDGAQLAGSAPVNLAEDPIDLFAFTGHKGLLGPMGTGGLAIREGLELETLREGGTGTESENPEPPRLPPGRYEAGTPNMPGIAGLLAGVSHVLSESVGAIRRRELVLVGRLLEGACAIRGLKVYGPLELGRKVGIVSVNFERLDPAEVGAVLAAKFGICVRTGLHCSPLAHRRLGTERRGAVRFGIGCFNTEAEIDAALEALSRISRTIRRGT